MFMMISKLESEINSVLREMDRTSPETEAYTVIAQNLRRLTETLKLMKETDAIK